MKKMLITGASGLLGSSIALSLSDKYSLTLLYRDHPIFIEGSVSIEADLGNPDAAAEIISGINPDIVVHCAAITNVDFCEKERDIAFRVNCAAVESIARVCRCRGCKLVYISTDSVFDGLRGGYSEKDEPNPLNYYAETKLIGESIVKKAEGDYLMLRTNLYGVNYQNKSSLSEWILKTAMDKREVSLFKDVYFNPMYAGEIANILDMAVKIDLRGLYHLGCREGLSKLEFGRKIIDFAGISDINIKEVSVEEMSFTAKRPKNTVLFTDKIEKALGMAMPGIDNGIRKFLKRIADNKYISGGLA